MGALAVTWIPHRRTTVLCAGLGIELAVMTTRARGAFRYAQLGARTLSLLMRRRPRVLLVQNPSLVLALLTLLLRPIWRYRLVVDAHNEAIEPFVNRQFYVRWLSRWVVARADVTIVTNRQLAQIAGRQGGRTVVLPDRIPGAPPPAVRRLSASFNVVLIATFAADEPVTEVIEAVQGMPVSLYITGNAGKWKLRPAALPDNVHFTGFLEEADYWALLSAADGIVDLTRMDNCLVCGAYEALAAGRPMLLTGNDATRELFAGAAIFTDNTVAGIRAGLTRLQGEGPGLAAAASRKRADLDAQWLRSAQALRARILDQDPARGAASG